MKHHRSHFDRVTLKIIVGLAILALLMFSLPPAAQAQEQPDEPDNVVPRVYLPFIGTEGLQSAAPPAQASVPDQGLVQPGAGPLKLLVDTDMGVDDAVALTWLISQNVIPLGVVTVAGNTSVENATSNVLYVLDKLGIDVPVVMGASKPQKQKLSKTGWLIHGPDGMWGLRSLSTARNLAHKPIKADKFYCDTVAAYPGATLLALGPLTNIADAYKKCPEVMAKLGRVVVLGGAKFGGNKTPVAEFNFWQDPEAAEFVLSRPAKLHTEPIDLVPLDTFVIPSINGVYYAGLCPQNSSPPLYNSFLLPALCPYLGVQLANTGMATIPDAVAATYAVSPTIALTTPLPALVKMVLEKGQARGQSVIGLTIPERIAMIADDNELSRLAERAFYDPNFILQDELDAILQREPPNAEMLTDVPSNLLTGIVLPDLKE